MTYLDKTVDVYKEAALKPQEGLCCTTTPIWELPNLHLPDEMLRMNYGCGSTVHPRDLVGNPKILYVGVGGGMELLQFSYFTRREESVIGVDSVPEMIDVCRNNLKNAARTNSWFDPRFVHLKSGDALDIPLPDESMNVAAQNCLFNIFKHEDLKRAISEMYRVLKPYGRLILSDPICEDSIPDHLREDDKLRAECLSGSIPLKEYIKLLTDAGFGTIEVRAKRPYRVLSPAQFNTSDVILIESVEVAAIKDPMPFDGPCVFTGRTAIYFGIEEWFDDGHGHLLKNNQPLSVCDKTASALENLNRNDILITDSTWYYDGGGGC